MNQESVRFALVGCGKISRKHCTALQSLPGASLAAVCDRDPEAARRVAGEFGVGWYSSLPEMLDVVEPDAVCVLTPSGSHGTVAAEIAERGIHVVVEKPMVLDVEEGRRLVTLCGEREVGLFVVNQNRMNRPIRRLRAALEAGRFGKMVLGSVRVRWKRTEDYYGQAAWRGTWKLDGGVLANQALHHLDMLLWLMGEVESVACVTATRLASIEAEDTAVAALRFRNGALGIIEATTAARPRDLEGSLSILGEGGSAEVGGFAMDELRTWQFVEPTADDEDVWEEDAKNPADRGWNHARYLERVARTIRSGTFGVEEGVEACRVTEFLEALYDSAAAGNRTVPGTPLGLSLLGKGGS